MSSPENRDGNGGEQGVEKILQPIVLLLVVMVLLTPMTESNRERLRELIPSASSVVAMVLILGAIGLLYFLSECLGVSVDDPGVIISIVAFVLLFIAAASFAKFAGSIKIVDPSGLPRRQL